MKERMESKEIKEYYASRLNDNKKELEKIEKVHNLKYFEDLEVEGYPWWEEWRKQLGDLEAENLQDAERWQEVKNKKGEEAKAEEYYAKYANSDKKLQDLKIKIDKDVDKYKKLYKERIIDTLSETIEDFRETVTHNIAEIDKEIKRLNDRKDLLIKDKENLRESYKGDDYDSFFYEKINKLFAKINELTKERESLIKLELELDIEEFTKIIEKNKKIKDKPVDGKTGKDKPADGKAGKDKQVDGKAGKDKQADGKAGKDKQADGKVGKDKQADGKTGKDKPADGKDKQADGKTDEDKPVDGKAGKDKQAEGKIGIEEDRDIYSNSYEKVIGEYNMLLDAYEEALEMLYELHQKYENGDIEYSEYEKQADYISDIYPTIKEEYKKVLDRYNKENKKGIITKEELETKLKEAQKELKLSGDRLQELKGYDEPYAAERATYSQIVEKIAEIERQIKERDENPLKYIPTEELVTSKEELQRQLEASGKRLEELKGYDGPYAEERATYSELVKKISAIDKELNDEARKARELEKPVAPNQPMFILEKENESAREPELDYDAIQEEYAYRKQDMVDKFMGNRDKAQEYEERLNRFKSHIVEREFTFVNKEGETCTGIYKTVEEYEDYESDTFFLQLEEYKDRIENMSRFDSGDKSVYKDKRDGDRIITAQEQRDNDDEYIKTYNYAYNSHKHTQNNLMTLGNYGDKVPYSKFEKKQPVRNILRATGNVLKFARNWTIAPASRFIGKRIIAPIHKAIYKPEESNPNPYKGRLTHRYEQRKNYFQEQGKGYISSTFSALFKYKEGNRGALAERGGEIYQSIENKYMQLAQRDAQVQLISGKIDNIDQEIIRINSSLELVKSKEERELLEKKLELLSSDKEKLKKDIDIVLGKRVDHTVQTDAIDTKTHDRSNKRNITRAVTTVKALAIGATRYIGPKLHRYILDKTQTQVVSWQKGADTIINTRKYVKGNYEEITVGDFMQDDVTTTYAANGITPHNTSVTPKMARGFAIKDGTPGDGFSSFIDGNGMTQSEITRIADKLVPSKLLDNLGNLSPSAKLIDLAKEAGINIQSKADMESFIRNLELCLSESGTGIGHRSGWVGNLLNKLKTPLTDGHWTTVTTTVPGKMQQIITYADNTTLKKIFGLIEKGTDGVIIADVIDQIYENIRQTQGKGKGFESGRPDFDDKGKTKGPVGFDYDRKGRNKNTDKNFVPTYSPEVLNALGAETIEELKERLVNVKKADLTEDELAAIYSKKEELQRKDEHERRTPKGEPIKDLGDKAAEDIEPDK